MNREIPNLLCRVLRASGLPRDKAYLEWALFVDGVDPTGTDIEAFAGNYIGKGTVTVGLFTPRVILASTCIRAGERRVRHYRVLILEMDRSLTVTDIRTHDASPGWVQRIADDTLDLLASLAQPEPGDDTQVHPAEPGDEAQVHPEGPEFGIQLDLILRGRAYKDLFALRILTLGISDYEIIQEALACYRAELSHQEVER